jgi:hypothetical protein
MNLPSFCIVTALALLFAVLNYSEANLYQSWTNTLTDQKELQAKLANAQHLNEFTQALLRRVAIDSQHDPALADVLKKNDIKVVISKPVTTISTVITPPIQPPIPAPAPAFTNADQTPAAPQTAPLSNP